MEEFLDKLSMGDDIITLEHLATIDVNARYGLFKGTLLHYFSRDGNTARMKFLMNYPGIDVNKHDGFNRTPLDWAVDAEENEAIKMLLLDPRVSISNTDAKNKSTFERIFEYFASEEIALACRRREMVSEDAIAGLQEAGYNEEWMAMDYTSNALFNSARCCLKWKIENRDISSLYALVLVIQEGYFRVSAKFPKDYRFFSIITRLPPELSMIICNRVYWSPKLFIPSTLIEEELRDIIKQEE
jgi:hypothetical protein